MSDNVVQLSLFQPDEEENTIVAEEYRTLVISPEHVTHALEQYLKSTGLWPYGMNVYLMDADFGLELNEDGLAEIDLTLIEEFPN